MQLRRTSRFTREKHCAIYLNNGFSVGLYPVLSSEADHVFSALRFRAERCRKNCLIALLFLFSALELVFTVESRELELMDSEAEDLNCEDLTTIIWRVSKQRLGYLSRLNAIYGPIQNSRLKYV